MKSGYFTPHPHPARRLGIVLLLTASLLAITAGFFLFHERTRVYPVPILMYHKIGDGVASPWWVAAEDFEAHLQSLKEQGYHSIFPSELAAHQAWGRPLPSKPVILTFDDGYLNTVTGAEPLLRKYGFRAVCYLITGQIGDAPDSRRLCEGAPLLSWPEVREAQRRGTLRFGGHTRSHANLMAMKDPRGEIEDCYRDIRKRGGFKPEGFCYPFGQYKPETPAVVAQAGFATAVTCNDGVVATTNGMNLFELPRVSMMGGPHVYHVERVAATNAVAVRVWKEGHSMQVQPRWVFAGPDNASAESWSAPVTIASNPAVLKCPRSATTPTTLELWDDYRVIRLFRHSL